MQLKSPDSNTENPNTENPNTANSSPQVRPIRRKQLQQQLALSSMITMLAVSGCSSSSETEPKPIAPSPRPKVPALFYSNTEACEADIEKQTTTYNAQLTAYEANKKGLEPKPPALGVEDCAGQMATAKREHDRHAPVYQSLSDCQADGVKCETTTSSGVSGYRPTFGGAYLYPYAIGANRNFAGYDYRAYQPHTVYQSSNPGQVMTPQGELISQVQSGRVSAPDLSSVTAPARPSGYAAMGTIRGRSQTGFGSTYKSTGDGGK